MSDKEKQKKFDNKKSETITIAGFLSITKRLVALFDRIILAISSLRKEIAENNELKRQEIKIQQQRLKFEMSNTKEIELIRRAIENR